MKGCCDSPNCNTPGAACFDPRFIGGDGIVFYFHEISINVVPITEQDDKIHNNQIPSDDCFAHLEVQFRFIGLSPEVEGVLGRIDLQT
ncbi:Late embryogenesis abundant (LEA) protein-like protein [Thalictrum thalictroides]|uniref:Late embryogenesis abundant (LEA) protein-like protein n=1 Tax=Thalictrum thalictroides TaxID=46969 RepID=A0A7J6WVJ0_THATH|nr:Late embryogenesis abundant (LEA) protein-like protein [Thalictrum thalictroides]